MFRAILLSLLAVATLPLGAPVHAADDYPSKPIRLIVPFPPGASADVRSRQIAALVAERFKQQMVVDNRPGAAGSIGTALAAKAPPDGYTVAYILNTTVAVNPHLYRDAGFDPLKDLQPFILTVSGAPFLVVKADSSIRTVKDLIEQAKAKPGKLTYGTSGAGSPQHLMGERLKQMAGIDLAAVPYKGDAPTLVDLMGGQIDMAFGFPLAALPHIQSGKLRPLAVTTAKRLSSFPDIPTLAESGVAGYDETVWTGFAVPTGTPAAIVTKLHDAFHAVMVTPEFKRDVEKSGAELIASSQEEAVARLKRDYERYGKIVKELNLKID